MAGVTWRYRLRQRVELFAPELLTIAYAGPWLEIRHCHLAIPAGYAWDGCSPTLRLPGGLWLGPWDGPLGTDGRPAAWRASLVHDALCQFRTEIPGLTKATTVRLFRRLLAADGAPYWMQRIYPAAVDLFGPQAWGGFVPA